MYKVNSASLQTRAAHRFFRFLVSVLLLTDAQL